MSVSVMVNNYFTSFRPRRQTGEKEKFFYFLDFSHKIHKYAEYMFYIIAKQDIKMNNNTKTD